MNFVLVVTHEFGGYAQGDRISDKAQIEAVLASHPGHVVKVLADMAAPAQSPAYAPAPAPAADPDA